MFDLIKVLLPLIIQLFADKKEKGEAANAQDAVDCWKTVEGRQTFAADLVSLAISTGAILPAEAPHVVLSLAELADNPLLPLFVETLYQLPALAE